MPHSSVKTKYGHSGKASRTVRGTQQALGKQSSVWITIILLGKR